MKQMMNYLNWGHQQLIKLNLQHFLRLKFHLEEIVMIMNFLKIYIEQYKRENLIKLKIHRSPIKNWLFILLIQLIELRNEKPLQNSNLMTADIPPDIFDITYRINYIDYDDKICRLRKYFNSKGMRYLLI